MPVSIVPKIITLHFYVYIKLTYFYISLSVDILCNDGIQNGLEEDIDCGISAGCHACPTCSDGIQNGDEEGVDCGGTGNCTSCATCIDGIQNGDEEGVDCGGTGNCVACPNCTDGIRNGNEEGVDCGGSNCQKCGKCFNKKKPNLILYHIKLWKCLIYSFLMLFIVSLY